MSFLSMSSHKQIRKVNLTQRSRRPVDVAVVNPFSPFLEFFKREDPIVKSRKKICRLYGQIRAEQARLVYLSGQNDPKIKEYINQHYRSYMKMEYAPHIPVVCPHCHSPITLYKNCYQCGWRLGVHFSDVESNGDLLATPTLNSPIKKGEIMICINQIPYNKNQMINLYQMEQDCRQKQQQQVFYQKPKILKKLPPPPPPVNRHPSVNSDASGYLPRRHPSNQLSHHTLTQHPPKLYQHYVRGEPESEHSNVLEPDRVVSMSH